MPVVVTVFPLPTNVNVPAPLQLDVPFHVPLNCTPALPPPPGFVHDEIAINVHETIAISATFSV